jgi:acetolactate synthase-1/2/3 large subunit
MRAAATATNAFAHIDCLLATGTRFAEIPTGSYGIKPPKNLIHLDINPRAFSANYPASITLEGDAKSLVPALLSAVKAQKSGAADSTELAKQIAADEAALPKAW